MNGFKALALTVVVLGAGCVSDSSDGGNSCQLTGTYLVQDERDPDFPGDCPPSLDGDPGDTYTLQVYEDGSDYAIVINGIMGNCPAQRNGCSLTAACVYWEQDTMERLGTATYEFEFTPDGFEGFSSSILYADVIPGAPDGCEANYIETGTRR